MVTCANCERDATANVCNGVVPQRSGTAELEREVGEGEESCVRVSIRGCGAVSFNG